MIDPQPLATVEELQERLSFDLEPEEMREARGALMDLSDEARVHGRASWTAPNNTPSAVRNLVLKAAARFMKNYEGFIQSRAGDETLMWTDRKDNAGSAYFTEPEVRSLVRMAGGSTLTTVPYYAWGRSGRSARYSRYGYMVEGDLWVETESDSIFPWVAKEDM